MGRFSIMVFLLISIGIFPLTIIAEKDSENLNITWENSGDITFVVPSEQWFQFGIGVNSTSTDSQSIIIEIIGNTNWGINESIFQIKGVDLSNQDSFVLNANESTIVNVKIYIPEIQNGTPLAETEYQFQLKLSNSTGANEFWNYGISILPKYSIEIDEIKLSPNIDPAGTVTHEVKIRNTGNILTQFTSEISPLDDEGNLILTNETNRFVKSGWNATLSGWIEAISLAPNQSITLRIAINAPYSDNGNLSTRLHIESNLGTVSENIYLNTTILTIKKSEIQLTNTECEQNILDESCKLNIKITNKGNFREGIQNTNCSTNLNYINFNNNSSNTNQIQITEINSQEESLEPEEFINFEFDITLENGDTVVEAGTVISVECNYISKDSTILDSTSINFTIKENYEIKQFSKPESWVNNSRLYLSINLENKGNTQEGFTVSMSVSHEVNHGLILPENAIFDNDSLRIRSYDILECEPYGSINITGWMEIPQANIEDELFWISIDVSTYSNSFENTWETNMTIQGTGSIDNELEQNKEFEFDTLKNMFNAYGYSLLAIFIATIMIYNALKIRAERTNLVTKDEVKSEKDWMSTFFVKKNNNVNLESPSINKNEFKQKFSEKVGNKKIVEQVQTDKNKLKKASETIDLITQNSNKNEKEILEDLLDGLSLDDEEYDY